MEVAYKCYASHNFYDLQDLYFCDSCTSLVSKHPLATFEEIESYYCGNCLENVPSSDAQSFQNKCTKCFECPVCSTTLSIFTFSKTKVDTDTNRDYYMGCSHCRWNSKLCNIVEESVSALVAKVISREKNDKLSSTYEGILKNYREKSFNRDESNKLRTNNESDKSGPWKWIDVENMLQQKNKKDTILTERRNVLEKVNLEKLVETNTINLDELTTLNQRINNIAITSSDKTSLIPNRKLLKTKKSRRCIKCVESNRSGILIKPQISPLHGDSSRVVDVGSWFKKQNSARYYLPIISFYSIKKSELNDNEGELFLNFTNPASMYLSSITSDLQVSFLKIDEEKNDNTVILNHKSMGPFLITSMDEIDVEGTSLDSLDDDKSIIVKRTFNSILLSIPYHFTNETFKNEGIIKFYVNIEFTCTMGGQTLKMNIETLFRKNI